MTRLIKINIIIFAVSSILIVFSGCKSKKESLDTSGTLENKSMKTLVQDILEKEVQYKTIESKGKIELRKGNSGMKTTAVFKLVKDSIIQASVRIPIIGGEAMRINFTPNDILIIDRMHKQYALLPYSEIQALGNSNSIFFNIQSLFTNKLFILGEESVSTKDHNKFNLSSTPEVYMLQPKNTMKGPSLTFAIDATDRIASTLIYDKDKPLTIQWSYGNFVVDKESVYPTTMDVKLEVAKRRFDVGIECPNYDIDNKGFKIDSSIPKNYVKANFMDIISNYMNKIN